ncbi:glycosyltransferase [Burkholderia pseudomultivorans]|uniref:glycosyltransferase n=1 Tax=Burkholderia pseudomultivorans TaxID=1207504 RepID=UPI000752CCDE|nr:nucleotide disphospho-sugar-binding domain-containing protein [Burkholderia pseudomultivorans]KVC30987.1 glycosyl transferase family 1 [Burkholderia pseudomultivorans]KVC31655.1 glycosyl transferase family 1 [Burkholderia pseudomultivorans]KVC47586.1 glycosyl transferase family 1 [Burkholderia pseudomultivorans]MDS0793314.1 glycosyltransferase [Burkholderia pseudomultivorans]
MAKVIVTAIGSAGDVHPLLGVARALAARGHELVFCTHPPFEPAVRRCGFAFVPVGTAAEYEAAMANPALWDPRTSFRTLWQVIAPVLRPHYDALHALTDADTVLVGTLWAFSARFMQELHGTPYVSVQVSPSTLLSAHAPPTHKRLTIPARWPLPLKSALMTLIERQVLDRVCGPALNAARDALGLPPARRVLGRWLHSTDGVLCLFPDWFAPPQRDWPSNHRQSGFPLFNDIATSDDDAELDAFLAAGEPPVVFTAGSTRVDHAAYARAVSDALRATGARGLLLTPDAAAAGTDRLLARRFVPMRTLLPRCRALVHHGGIGTAALAFEAGIAQVVTPFAHDQFDNAQRVAASGCGVRVDGPVDGARLGAALARVLGDPAFASRAAHVRARLAAEPDGCEAAADFIERFVPAHDRAAAPADTATAGA